MRRYLPVALVGSGLVLGLVLLLLALDVARADRGLTGDDARFLTQPRISGYWRDDGVLPFGAGRRLLGAEDDLAFRRAAQRFWLGRPGEGLTPTPARLAERALAQAQLSEVDAGTGATASQKETLLGVLALLTPPDEAERTQVVRAAANSFRRAVLLDPANHDAKFNLESLLQLVGDQRNRGQGGGGSAGQEGTEFGGAAVSRRGSGY